jgi:hypothetical protein
VLAGWAPAARPAAARLTLSAQKIRIPGSKTVWPVALSDEGQALMGSTACSDCSVQYYFWSKGHATAIGSPGGVTNFEPYALDDEGWFAGNGVAGDQVESFVGNVTGHRVSFTSLQAPPRASGILAFAMNARGDVLGVSQGANPAYYLWPSGDRRPQLLNLAAPDGATAVVTGIDDGGDYAGIVQTSQGAEAVVWPAGRQPVVLPGSLGDNGGGPLAIGGFADAPNDATILVSAYQPPLGKGQGVAQYWTVRSQTWAHPAEASAPVPLGKLSPNDKASIATGISPSGWVIGSSLGSHASARAFLYRDGGLSPLRRFVTGAVKPPAYAFNQAPLAINARNQILLGAWILTPR